MWQQTLLMWDLSLGAPEPKGDVTWNCLLSRVVLGVEHHQPGVVWWGKGCRRIGSSSWWSTGENATNLGTSSGGPRRRRASEEPRPKNKPRNLCSEFFRLICLSSMRCVIGKIRNEDGQGAETAPRRAPFGGGELHSARFINLLIRSLLPVGPPSRSSVQCDKICPLEFVVYVPKFELEDENMNK